MNFLLNLVMIKNFGAYGACLSTIVAELTVVSVQFYFTRSFIKPQKLIKPVLLFIPASVVMYIVVRIIGNYMGAGILTNIVQGLVGALTYFIIIEVFYRVFKKQSIVNYIKNIVKS